VRFVSLRSLNDQQSVRVRFVSLRSLNDQQSVRPRSLSEERSDETKRVISALNDPMQATN
jgi:hypothetical protein